MKDVEPLEQLFLAIRDLRKAERKSKEMCEEMGKNPSNYVKAHWTKAAVERDRCYDYAKKKAIIFFGLESPSI